MTKTDVICPKCHAGFRRIELSSRRGTSGEYRCPICNQALEAFDGSQEIAYRLTVTPVKTKAG
jgi:ssDNA-binding Zn-finger/Zn-ribbon topoisomerase 1